MLLELARLFSGIYSNELAKPAFAAWMLIKRVSHFHHIHRVNLLFVLTAGGMLNFHGTQHWAESLGTTLLQNTLSVCSC